MNLFAEVSTEETKFVLQKYATSRKVVRLALGREGQAVLLRVTEVGDSIFHADIVDPQTRGTKGKAHLPVSLATNIFCLDEDNTWFKLEKALSL